MGPHLDTPKFQGPLWASAVGVSGSHGHSLSSSMRLIGLVEVTAVDSTASRFRCKKVKHPLPVCVSCLAAWRTYAWTSASSGARTCIAHATMHQVHLGAPQCTARRAVHPKKCIPHWWAAAKGRPPAFDLTRPLFQTVLSSLARVESVSAAM